jgi:TLC ATP/ADP transporter
VCGGAGQIRAKLPPGVDGWGYSLKGMMGMVVIGGLLVSAAYFYLNRTVVKRLTASQPKKKKVGCSRLLFFACAARAAPDGCFLGGTNRACQLGNNFLLLLGGESM